MDVAKTLAEIAPASRAFITLLDRAVHDGTKTAPAGAEDPLATLESMGVEVEPEFRAAVATGLDDLLQSLAGHERPAEPELAAVDLDALTAKLEDDPLAVLDAVGKALDSGLHGPVGAGLRGALGALGKAYRHRDADGHRAVRLVVKPWGVALALDGSATRKATEGIDMTLAVANAVAVGLAGATTLAGPYALLAAVVVKTFCLYLTANKALIGVVDRGKGVYLTLTWLHILCLLPPWWAITLLAATPVPIPIT